MPCAIKQSFGPKINENTMAIIIIDGANGKIINQQGVILTVLPNLISLCCLCRFVSDSMETTENRWMNRFQCRASTTWLDRHQTPFTMVALQQLRVAYKLSLRHF